MKTPAQLEKVNELKQEGYKPKSSKGEQEGPTYLISPGGKTVAVSALGNVIEMPDGILNIPGENAGKAVVVKGGEIIGAQG